MFCGCVLVRVFSCGGVVMVGRDIFFFIVDCDRAGEVNGDGVDRMSGNGVLVVWKWNMVAGGEMSWFSVGKWDIFFI
jgi:hypothetical protein